MTLLPPLMPQNVLVKTFFNSLFADFAMALISILSEILFINFKSFSALTSLTRL